MTNPHDPELRSTRDPGEGIGVKVVTNRCFGGFSISLAAARRMAELGHAEAAAEVAKYDEKIQNPRLRDASEKKRGVRWYGNICRDYEHRTDPILVQAVEELGSAADGEFARLNVAEVPADARWHIDSYDGAETIHEDHRQW